MKNNKKYIIICSIIVLLLILLNISTINRYMIQKKRANNLENVSKISYIHISIDDCIDIFEDLNTNKEKYKSISDNNLIKYLKYLNEEYRM